jgi:serine/threonine protein kinase
MHKKDRIHKALRPENILVDRRGDIKLGLFTIGEERDIQTRNYYYLAPEVVTSNIYTTKVSTVTHLLEIV